jgi:uncharacterized phage-associated protein
MRNIDRQKYRQAILAFLIHCNNVHLGVTKLMKLLYYLDFDHFERTGTSVTGESYLRWQFGPFPQHAWRMLHEMRGEGLIGREIVVVGDKEQVRHYPTQQGIRAYNPDVFSETEWQMFIAVRDRWGAASRREIVDATHREAPWLTTEDGQEIPYETAYDRNSYGEFTPAERESLLRAAIASEGLEGFTLPYEVASQALDEVLREPMPTIG